MTIEKRRERAGVNVHLEPEECELFMKLAADAETVNQEKVDPLLVYSESGQTYLALSLTLGRKINALLREEPNLLAGVAARPLACSMVNLILADQI